MIGLLKLLFGGKKGYEITCPSCGLKGKMFTKGGAYEGIFEIVGKTQEGGLKIKACPNCNSQLQYDPLAGKTKLL